MSNTNNHLPDRWTVEDIQHLLEQVETKQVLVADSKLGLPTIHDFPGARHLGMGVFTHKTPDYTILYDAGTQMQRTPSGQGWTSVRVEEGEFPYDFEGVRATLQGYLDNAVTDEVHELVFGDNGQQVYFEGDEYLLLNPYMDRLGQRYASGWTWFQRNGSDDWLCVPDPEAGEHSLIGSFSLEKAVASAERVLETRFELVGAPDDLPDSYPTPEPWWDDETDPTGFIAGEGDAYDYIPSWMKVPKLYTAEKQDDPLAVIKLFTPDSNWTWYILEYDGEDTCFGLVDGFETELGYFSLAEMREVTGPHGMRIERDLWFKPTPVTLLPEYERKWGRYGGPYKGTPAGVEAKPEPKPVAEPPKPTPRSKREIERESKQIARRLKEINGRMDVAYDVAINDPQSLQKLEAERAALFQRKRELTEELRALLQPEAPSQPDEDEPPAWTITQRLYQERKSLAVAGGVPILNVADAREHERLVREAVARGELAHPYMLLKDSLAPRCAQRSAGDPDLLEADVLYVEDVYGTTYQVSRYDYERGANQIRIYAEKDGSLTFRSLLPDDDPRRKDGETLHRDNIAKVLDAPEPSDDDEAQVETWVRAVNATAEAVDRSNNPEDIASGDHERLCAGYELLAQAGPEQMDELEALRAEGATVAEAEAALSDDGPTADPTICDNAYRNAFGRDRESVARIPMCQNNPVERVVTIYDDETDPKDGVVVRLCTECYTWLREDARLCGYRIRSKRFEPDQAEPEAEPPVEDWQPDDQDLAEFDRWELHLLTGMLGKRSSAFYKALRQVTRPGTLRLALQGINGSQKRRNLIEKRLTELTH